MMENSNLQSTSESLVEIENPIGVLKDSVLSWPVQKQPLQLTSCLLHSSVLMAYICISMLLAVLVRKASLLALNL